MFKSNQTTRLTRLFGATALGFLATSAQAQQGAECTLVGGAVPPSCEQSNAGTTVLMPVQENTDAAGTRPTGAASGFVISINGDAISADPGVANVVRRTDVALADADVQVVFDGLGANPRLDLEVVGPDEAFRAGDTVRLQSALNYPAFVTRGELRVIDRSARGGAKTVQIVPIAPNGQASLTVPEGKDIIVVHRVYDAKGRYDETGPLALGRPDQRDLTDGVEDGSDSTAIRRIPVHGGAVTVSGTGVAAGGVVTALGEQVRPDPSGGFVIQRILPPGDYGVDVNVRGAGQTLDLTRDVEIPASEWFYVATGDLTFGRRRDGATNTSDSFSTGRLAFYVDGRRANGVEITASADTGEGDLKDIFHRLEEKDPRSTVLRVDAEDLYPTYGDDSEILDNTPTSGRLYLRVEKDGNYIQWGDFSAGLDGGDLIRNDRTLYGLKGGYATQETTSEGEARARVMLYAAQPDMLPQRDVFLGTGGSVYFLEKQDISSASETISVQLRDRISGRVIDTVRLIKGKDYEINYIQGVVKLARPLQSGASTGSIVSNPSGNAEVHLVVQYEYTPTVGDVDGFNYGGRAEGWVTDKFRVGLSGTVENTGTADQTALGLDLLYRHSEDTYASLEVARTEGPGFGNTFSSDGGLVVDTIAPAGGNGTAVKAELRLGLRDAGLAADGAVGGYYERRTLGYSTLDHQVTAATGDEDLWGVFAEVEPTDRLRYAFSYDSYENDIGNHERTGEAELEYQASDRLAYAFGVEHIDRKSTTETGRRTDVAARLTYGLTDLTEVYVLGQATVDVSGLARNNRVGLGASIEYDNGWSLDAEISDGNQGAGGRLMASFDDGAGTTRYAGYELEPGRLRTGTTLQGDDRGRFVMGGARDINERVSVFGENSYDVFGQNRTLTSAYGLTYTPNEVLSYTTAIEYGTVNDALSNSFDRTAVSLGAIYKDESLSASGRIEYRTEKGLRSGNPLNADTFLFAADARYKINESQRLIFSLDAATTQTNQSSILNGDYGDVVFGYAYRPVVHDRLNVLARYRYLHDLYGQRLDDADKDGQRQKSHVISIDASYDLDPHWTLGGKLGYRISETAADQASPFVQNDAYLAAISARYHIVHNWDAMVELRKFDAIQTGVSEFGAVGTVYRHFGNNFKLGIGYNFGSFSDDLTDLTHDDKGAFVNLIAKF
ncbi:MAG: hypothetical protein WA822_04075 [Albidovulum sp.]